MTTLYCGMTGSNGPIMFDSMDEALNNGAEGIAIFTVNSLRSPEIRAQFKAYADSARASRTALKGSPVPAVTKVVNSNPFENEGIMKAVNLHITAHLSLDKALKLPALKKTDKAVIERIALSSLQGNTAEDYINRLNNSSRRDQTLVPVSKALAEQFTIDYEKADLKLSEYKLVDEYGATRVYQITEQNSKVVFKVTFYFYGGIISGWSVAPEA
jgi:hypothetical protein